MKPTSIIFMIVAVVLILSGVVTCVVATNIAEKEGVMLFPEKEDSGNAVLKHNLDEMELIRLDILCDEADISIKGGAEESYIEIINYNANYYKLGITGKTITFDETPDIMSMLKFWENGTSFKGLRYIFRVSGDGRDKSKRINVYLKDDTALKIINVESEKGEVIISDLPFNASYSIKTGTSNVRLCNLENAEKIMISEAEQKKHSLKFEFDGLKSKEIDINCSLIEGSLKNSEFESLKLVYSEGNADIKDTASTKLSINSEDGSTAVSGGKFSDIEGKVKAGNINVELSRELELYQINLLSETGLVKVNGENYDGSYSTATGDVGAIDITSISGNISLSHIK